MVTKTEAVYLADVVLFEERDRFSRESRRVAASQTLVIGSVCQRDASNRMVLLTAEADEVQVITPTVEANADCVQTITTTGTQSGGTFKLGVRDLGEPDGAILWTDTIAWSATEATQTASVQTALDNLLGSNEIVATTIVDTATMVLVLTWSGTNATNKVQGEIGIDMAALTGAEEATVVITTPGAGTISAGTYRIGITDENGDVQWTDEIAFDANAAAIITALDATGLTAGSVVATGGPISGLTAVTLTWSGNEYTNLPQPLAEIDFDLVGAGSFIISRTTGGGQGIQDGTDCVQTVTITGGSAGTFTLAFNDKVGDLKTTTALAWNASAATIETAIDVALGTDSVTVSGNATSFTITFDGPDYDERAQDLVVLDISSLTDEDGTSAVVMTTPGFPAHTTEAEAICLKDLTTVGGEVLTETLFLVRHGTVNQDRLDFNSGNMARAIEELAKAGIIMRREPQKTSTQTT